jgi:FMN reductase
MSDARPIRVVGFGGTLKPSSTTIVCLRHVLSACQAGGAHTTLVEAGALELPTYDWGAEPTPEVERFAAIFHGADALVWASPLYHGTISGLFKNAIDWLEILRDRAPPYLTDKPVGLIGIAGGGQSLQVITSMEQIVRSLRGWTIPFVVPINRAADVFGAAGDILDRRVGEQLDQLASELLRSARIFRPA